LRQLQNKREDDVHTPSARHQANLISSSELRTIAQTPLPLNVFGASIEEANRLELFVKEVVDYRQSITDLQQRSKQLHNDPAMNNVNNGDRSSGKYSKRCRSNVAVIIIRILFISSFLFYCLLSNHSFQTNPNRITNCFKLLSLFTTYNYIAPASLF